MAGEGVVRWVFTDPVTSAEYEVALNPNKGGTPPRRKNIKYVNTAAPDGKVLMFEGREDPKEIEISGVILEEDHLDALNEWYEKRYQVQLTDDLSRTYTIYITSFEATRRRAFSHPWKHDYVLRYTVIDW